MSIIVHGSVSGSNIDGSCEDSFIITNTDTSLVLNDMLAAIAAKCVQADEAEKANNRLENFYASGL